MSTTAPALRVAVRCEGPLIVVFERSNSRPLEVRTNLTPVSLAEFLEEVSDSLNTLRRWSVGSNLKLALPHACEVLRRFVVSQIGNSSVLFRRGDRDRVQEFVGGALQAWRNSGSDAYRAPTVQITGSVDHLLPLEFLPLLDLSEPDPRRNTFVDFIEMAARFPAFSSIVHRTLLENPGPMAVELDNTAELKVRLFQHSGTHVARRGHAFLKSRDGIKVIGPWPNVGLPRPQFIADFAEQLWSGGSAMSTLSTSVPETRDHIQYFACHCDTQQAKTLDYSLLLALERKSWFGHDETNVTLRDLHQAIGGLPRRSSNEPLPLIFLNACGASRMKPTGVTSFPRFFLDNENICVIATETPIQDDFAEAFAREFYTELLRVAYCGEALFRARWRLLKDNRNPQGVLYSIYGGLDLRVRHAGVT